MRRILTGLVSTIIGVSLLVGLKTQLIAKPLGITVAQPDPATGAAGVPGVTPPVQPAVPTQPGAPAPSGVPRASSTPNGPGTTTAPSKPGAPTTTARTSAPAPPPASRTITGTAFAATINGDNYGSMQVKIVVTGTHIDDIITIQQSNRPKSVSTTLRTQALAAQSANVGNVSGATASSNAYKQSLASAIAKI